MSGEEGSNGAVDTDWEDSSMQSLEDGPEAMDDPTGGSDTPVSTSDSGGEAPKGPAPDRGTVRVPRKFRDAKEGRDPVTVYLSGEAKQTLKQLRRHLEDQYPDENIRRLDLYAAVVEAGLDGFEDVEEQMAEYGYGKEIE